MRHVATIASRELKALFLSPVAYVVLTLFSLLAALFFILNVAQFKMTYLTLAQMQREDQLAMMNLNDDLLTPFFGSMWVIFLLLVPAITMGLFSSDKTNSTEELLHTSPISIWDIVLGKYLAVAGFVVLLGLMLAVFPGFLFLLGDASSDTWPEVRRTLLGVLGLSLVGLMNGAVGAFASSLTRYQMLAFVLTIVFLFVIALFSIFGELASAGGVFGDMTWLGATFNYIAQVNHLDPMLRGILDTVDLGYFIVVIGIFLVLTKASVESVRWR